jgi:hypothetical protein
MAEGEVFELLNTESDWWLARKLTAADPEDNAFVPRNYVKLCDAPAAAPAAPKAAQPPVPAAPAAQVDTRPRVRAVHDFLNADDESFLTFRQGEELTCIGETEGEDWWLVENRKGEQGYVPSNYMQLL